MSYIFLILTHHNSKTMLYPVDLEILHKMPLNPLHYLHFDGLQTCRRSFHFEQHSRLQPPNSRERAHWYFAACNRKKRPHRIKDSFNSLNGQGWRTWKCLNNLCNLRDPVNRSLGGENSLNLATTKLLQTLIWCSTVPLLQLSLQTHFHGHRGPAQMNENKNIRYSLHHYKTA